MLKRTSGFTIVELLIVIVVIGILAAITIVAFNGVQTRAKNVGRHNELKAWVKQFEIYRAQEGSLPAMADAEYCLGTGFPTGYGGVSRCRDYMSSSASGVAESGNAALMTELRKVGTLPSGDRTPWGSTIGPYVNYFPNYIHVMGVFQGSQASDCPSGTTFSWTNGSNILLCRVQVDK